MKILGSINTTGDSQLVFRDIVDSEAYKLKVKESKRYANEDVWRFGFEDLRDLPSSRNNDDLDKLTRRELLEVCIEHRKKMPLIKNNIVTSIYPGGEEEKRLYPYDNLDQNKTDLQLYTEFFKVFPLIKRTEKSLEFKFIYLIPNIEFVICPIKSLSFANSKLLSALEGKSDEDRSYNFESTAHKSGFLSIDGRGKLSPYLSKDIKDKTISGLWIYNDTVERESKGKNAINQLVQNSCLNNQVWAYLLRFILSLNKLNNNIETASKS